MHADWLKQLRETIGDELSVETLDRFVSLRRSCHERRRQVWKSAAELAVWLAAVGGAAAAGMAFLVPDLADMYDAAGLAGSYRPTTRAVINAAGIGPRWWLAALALCLLMGLLPLVLRKQTMRLLRGGPVFGTVERWIDRAEWAGMLSLLLASRAAPAKSLRTLAEIFHETDWGPLSRESAERLEAGGELTEIFGILPYPGLTPWLWYTAFLLLPNQKDIAQFLGTMSSQSEAQARLRLTTLRAALRPVGVLLLVPGGILLLQAVCGPILNYLRTWN